MKTEDSIVGSVNLTGLGKCDIIIKGSSERYRTPHFHLISSDGKFETAICIYDNKYFNNEKETKCLLSTEQAKELEEAIKLPGDPEYDGDISMAIGMRILWIGKHGERYCKDNCPIPNYSNINFKEDI